MKRIIVAILFLFAVTTTKAQFGPFGLDTIKITNFILRAGDWSYLMNGAFFPRADSLSNDFVRQLQAKFDTSTLASGFNTHIKVDSIRGHTLFQLYQVYKGSATMDTELLGSFINSQVSAVASTPFQTAKSALDVQILNSFTQKRQFGFRFLKK